MTRRVDRPIFFIGMPRSGTTVIFEIFASHPDLAWLSQLAQRIPRYPQLAVFSRLASAWPGMRQSVSRTDQARVWRNRLRLGPVEAFRFWERCCGEKFGCDYLIGQRAASDEQRCVRSAVGKVLRYHGRPRFAAKLTGPGRISYLSSLFPDALFVHVVRDGRAVVRSLLKVPFWRERNRLQEPAWRNGLTSVDVEDWRRYGESPLALAAVQWRRVTESTRAEAREIDLDRYAEIQYERFIARPLDALSAITAFCGLRRSLAPERFLESRFELRDMNYQWRREFGKEVADGLDALLQPTLAAFGYGDGTDEDSVAAILANPFASAVP